MSTPAAVRVELPGLTPNGRARAAALQAHMPDNAFVVYMYFFL